LLVNSGAEKSIVDYRQKIELTKDELLSLCGQSDKIQKLKETSVEYLKTSVHE